MNIIQPNYKWAYGATARSSTIELIMHHLGSDALTTAEQVHEFHRDWNGWMGIAYHYYVRKDGKIYRGRNEDWTGGHTINHNSKSIGICFEGNFETEIMSDAQLRSGQELTADIKRRYQNIKIGGHREFNATACPGKNFPLNEMMNAEVKKNDPVPSDWAKEAWLWATKKNITDGTDPHGNVTREQVVTMLHRALK